MMKSLVALVFMVLSGCASLSAGNCVARVHIDICPLGEVPTQR